MNILKILFSNDKTTAKDEIVLCIITAFVMAGAAALLIFRDLFPVWLYSKAVTLAAVLILFSVMMIIIIVYRLSQNFKDNKKE